MIFLDFLSFSQHVHFVVSLHTLPKVDLTNDQEFRFHMVFSNVLDHFALHFPYVLEFKLSISRCPKITFCPDFPFLHGFLYLPTNTSSVTVAAHRVSPGAAR